MDRSWKDRFVVMIGDVCVLLQASEQGIVRVTEPIYQPFVKVVSEWGPCNTLISPDIMLNAYWGKMLNVPNLFRKFQNEQPWIVYKQDDLYRLICHSPLIDQFLWVVDVNRAFTDVTFYGNANPNFSFPSPLCYPVDRIIFMHFLAHREGAILHSAGMMLEGQAYLFAGKSGAGKTTISRLLASEAGMAMLSDDRMIVRKMTGEYRAYGTPWPGEARIAVNAGAPLAGLFFLTQASDNQIRPISTAEALTLLMPVISIPWYDRECVAAMLQFCDDLLASVPVYELRFRRDPSVVDMIHEFVTD